MEDLRHQLRMADLRARLEITEEKSGGGESTRVGVKLRDLQTWTQARSKVWPEETMTGSAIREPEMGQMNSFGAWAFAVFDGMADEDLLKSFHLRLGLGLLISVTLSGVWKAHSFSLALWIINFMTAS